MNKREIRRYLKELNEELKKEHVKGEICIVGGAAMCLALNARDSTKDIDAVFAPKMTIYKAAKRIAERHGLPDKWLNNGVKGFVTPDMKFEELLSFSHLGVLAAKPEYILAMKCLSSRTEVDIDDIKFLIHLLKIKKKEQVFSILESVYPGKLIEPKYSILLRVFLMSYKKTTLSEALSEYKNFQHRLNQFLDDFYSSDKTTKEFLIKEPPKTDDMRMLALADAIATLFKKRYRMKNVRWNGRFGLDRAWFIIPIEKLKPTLILQSPGEFRCRNIFVPSNYLERI